MTASKNRLCTGCGESIGLSAKFCEFCGQRIEPVAVHAGAKKAPKPVIVPDEVDEDSNRYLDEFDSRESTKLSREYFQAHADLLKAHRKNLKVMARSLDETERLLNQIGQGQVSAGRSQEVQRALEAIETLAEEWEDLQLHYNRESEALDEEFQERFAEMELDVEMPEDMQETMSRELEVMTRSFDRVGERIGTLGTLGNAMIARAEGRFFGAASSKRAVYALIIGTAIGWLGATLLALSWTELEPLSALILTAVAALMPIVSVSLFK